MVLRQPMLSSWDIIKKKIELILYFFSLYLFAGTLIAIKTMFLYMGIPHVLQSPEHLLHGIYQIMFYFSEDWSILHHLLCTIGRLFHGHASNLL